MVTITLSGPCCGSEWLVKYGVMPNGKQRCRCGAGGRRRREYPGSNAYPEMRVFHKD